MPIRLVSFRRGGQDSWGVAREDGIVDPGVRQGGSVLALLESGNSTEAAEEAAGGHAADFAVSDVTLLPPVVQGRKIICVGVNYANRNAEYRDNTPDPEWPSLFMRAYESFTGADQP